MKHIPVLLGSVLSTLGDVSGKRIIDATFGAGGYTRAFLTAGADVTAFDRDFTVIPDAQKIKQEYGDRFTFISNTFSHISDLEPGFDAIVFDLGISSMQIDIAQRGFSFRNDGPLDMRMSGDGISAADLIATSSPDRIAQILRDYGDVKKANILARAICDAKPKTTFELRDLIYNPHDVAPVFQALRIAVNDEFGEIERALHVVPDLLNVGGKCVCVTFHSLEDRIVKNIFRDWTQASGSPYLPIANEPRFKMLKTALPSDVEISNNSRARSAHMRAVEKSY
ncbi:MAG: 16S rRNA (cytosine(1402)-N(4))-methyltransferase RsmH [Proteobacteria bacterium]|nr:16S rRNA (cytosine(1402)-N(4))-methyltransferase RsmH [Candidatus Enterousia scatequi]